MRPELPALGALLWLSLSCSTFPAGEDVPVGRLPADTRPIEIQLELEIDPAASRFAGRAEIEIELDRARSTIWLHGQGLDVHTAGVEVGGEHVAARFESVDETGVAALRLARPVGPGRARLMLRWDAAFGTGLRGLYRVVDGEDAYAFTQMEAIDARRAFPCFDEPAFKAPFDVRLVVPADVVALANTPEVQTEWLEDGRVRRRFARTPPLPSYLLAWAVGPLDVVEAPPIEANAVRTRALPFRGVAVRGRGADLAHALATTPAILASIEAYTGSAYPFAKLDIVAVPDFAAGAMENVGLVTFRDSLLLIDLDTASVDQLRRFASVMAHELAHMWFGNLVTMPWWDDIWLNEAFATWLAARTITELYPDHGSDLAQLEATHGAMQVDSLATARRVREPIRSTHDIRSAFDAITYRKGGAVLDMIESAAGPDRFRGAIRRYLARHAYGTASSDDFLSSVEAELGSPFARSLRSFLDQPGLPFLQIEPRCIADPTEPGRERAAWTVTQSRYRPIGSSIDPSEVWSIPVCPAGSAACSWVDTERTEILELPPSCGSPTHPNRHAAGYYRWSLPADALADLLDRGWVDLDTLEKMSLTDALRAGYASAALDADEVLAAFARISQDPARPVATAPLGLLLEARIRLARTDAERRSAEAYVRKLYAARARALGFDAGASDDGERKLLRRRLVSAVVDQGRDRALRSEAFERGRRHLLTEPGEPDAAVAAAELLPLVARIAVADGGSEEFEAAWAHLFASEDSIVRDRMLRALGHARDPRLAERARSLVFEPAIRMNERLTVIATQAGSAENAAEREAVLRWVQEHVDEILAAISLERASGLLAATRGFCTLEAADEIEAWFGPRIDSFPGGPRRLAKRLELVRLCAARTAYQRESALAFLARQAEAAP